MLVNFELGKTAILPTKEHVTDAGYDIYAAHDVIIFGKARELVKTDLKYEIILTEDEDKYLKSLNLGVYASIRDRSGNALKKGITCLGGVIDYEYRGIIGVILYNTSGIDIAIKKGDKIAQLIFTPCFLPSINSVLLVGESSRGNKGFGSSGVAGN